jgi:Mn2+/Fe2+ NRAMP family transporter
MLGSAFLMATSAIGPGFITQTTVFTQQLQTSFGFVILCSVILDIIVQLNIWRIVAVSGMRAQDLANLVMPGSGKVLSFLIVMGGLAFNVGNIGGAALGFQVMFGVDLWIGVIFSLAIALLIFWYKEIGKSLDVFSKVAGSVMIVLTAYVAVVSNPPVIKTLEHTFNPEVFDTTAILILVGGTVGGYISFAGIHRLMDAGIATKENVLAISATSIKGVVIASLMRILLFMAALGVVAAGNILVTDNPAASVFRFAAGETGYRIFGAVLSFAALTSVVGSAYTSISFVKTYHGWLEKNNQMLTTIFVVVSAVIFLVVGRPVNILIIVGALNAFILPVALSIMLVASRRSALMKNYQHPGWLVVTGWAVVVSLIAMSIKTVAVDLSKIWQ